MTRVSENSSFHAIGYSVGKTKSRLEDLQLKGSNLKRIQKPSDDPIGNIELLTSRSKSIDADQYLRNASYAQTQLAFVENAIEELTNIVVKAKELAIGQASSFYGADVRKNIAREIAQLRKQSISVANRRLSNRYIFGGYKTLTKPFDEKGNYLGDLNTTTLEVSKDFFVPINFNGKDVFYTSTDTAHKDANTFHQIDPLTPEDLKQPNAEENEPLNPFVAQDEKPRRSVASTQPVNESLSGQSSIFSDLESLENALLTNNHEIVQALLPTLDDHLNRLISLRAKVGSVMNSVTTSEETIEKNKLLNEEYRSKIEDADVAELFSDLARQKSVLDATYKSSAQLMNQTLLDFVR